MSETYKIGEALQLTTDMRIMRSGDFYIMSVPYSSRLADIKAGTRCKVTEQAYKDTGSDDYYITLDVACLDKRLVTWIGYVERVPALIQLAEIGDD